MMRCRNVKAGRGIGETHEGLTGRRGTDPVVLFDLTGGDLMKVYRSAKAGRGTRETYDVLLGRWGLPVRERYVEDRYGKTHILQCGKADGEKVFCLLGERDPFEINGGCNSCGNTASTPDSGPTRGTD